jgi:hypothetical protein
MKHLIRVVRIVDGSCLGLSILAYPNPGNTQAIGPGVPPLRGFYAWLTLCPDKTLLVAVSAAIVWVLNRSALDNLKVFVALVATFAPFCLAVWVFSLW